MSPLKGMSLDYLWFSNSQVTNLDALAAVNVSRLALTETPVTNLLPLAGLQLTDIVFTPRNITVGIEAIRNMASLEYLSHSAEDPFGVPAHEFWAKYDAGEFD